MAKYTTIIGIMSGTSLDGLDICACSFRNKNDYKILASTTIPYDSHRKIMLTNLMKGNAEELADAHIHFGHYIGEEINKFIQEHSLKADLVSSHGHTIFHQPDNGFTFQLGSGASIAATCGITTVSDFRSTDVALGGEGAPLVPAGDKYLFSEYEYCMNIGGICNISFDDNDGNRIAGDICPGNMLLNILANEQGMDFDRDGEIASGGRINTELLDKLNSSSYYDRKLPKSLGKEDVDRDFIKLLNESEISVNDKLATVCEHIALQTAKITSEGKLLITGGGALNHHLISRIKANTKAEVIIPEEQIINYKEALVFALLGYLRVKEVNNSFSSVTGASRDSCTGAIYLP